MTKTKISLVPPLFPCLTAGCPGTLMVRAQRLGKIIIGYTTYDNSPYCMSCQKADNHDGSLIAAQSNKMSYLASTASFEKHSKDLTVEQSRHRGEGKAE